VENSSGKGGRSSLTRCPSVGQTYGLGPFNRRECWHGVKSHEKSNRQFANASFLLRKPRSLFGTDRKKLHISQLEYSAAFLQKVSAGERPDIYRSSFVFQKLRTRSSPQKLRISEGLSAACYQILPIRVSQFSFNILEPMQMTTCCPNWKHFFF
jgi:hypothetical protein